MIIIFVAIQQALISANFLLDNFMVAKLGDEFIAALGSSNKFMTIVRFSIISSSAAAAALISQFKAKKDRLGIDRSLVINLTLSISMAILFIIFFFTNSESILNRFTDSPEIKKISFRYLSIVIFSGITLGIMMPLVSSIRSEGFVISALLVGIVTIASNYLANSILMFGAFNLPKYGIEGAAIATLISESVSIISALALIKYMRGEIFNYRALSIGKRDITRYMKISVPAIFSSMLFNICSLFSHNIFGSLGEDELAAFGLLSSVESILFDVFAGFGVASVILIGSDLSRQHFNTAYSKAKQIILYGLLASVVVSLVLLFINVENLISTLSLDIDPEAVSHLKNMVIVLSIAMPVRVFTSIMSNGLLSSGGDNLFLMLTSIFTDWFIMLPTIYVGVTYFDWHIINVYITIYAAEVISAFALYWRFVSKRWMRDLT